MIYHPEKILIEELNFLVKYSLKAVFRLVCPEEASVTIEYFWMDITHTVANLTDKLTDRQKRSKTSFTLTETADSEVPFQF